MKTFLKTRDFIIKNDSALLAVPALQTEIQHVKKLIDEYDQIDENFQSYIRLFNLFKFAI